MSDKTKHILLEGSKSVELTIETSPEHPGKVFLHIMGGGFSYCQAFTAKQARHVGMAFFDAMDAAESVTGIEDTGA